MAQRTIHMLFAKVLSEKVELKDKNRFFIGSIMPDSYVDPGARKKAHFMRHTADDNGRFFDFPSFYEKYKEKIVSDDLYLGYYAHLVEDAFYRYFIYYEKDFMSKLASYELTVLHKDYSILNSYISSKYDMPLDIKKPADYDGEVINEIALFDIDKIISDYEEDLKTQIDEKPVLLTEEMLEEFVEKYADLMAKEIESVKTGKSVLNALDYSWENKQ